MAYTDWILGDEIEIQYSLKCFCDCSYRVWGLRSKEWTVVLGQGGELEVDINTEHCKEWCCEDIYYQGVYVSLIRKDTGATVKNYGRFVTKYEGYIRVPLTVGETELNAYNQALIEGGSLSIKFDNDYDLRYIDNITVIEKPFEIVSFSPTELKHSIMTHEPITFGLSTSFVADSISLFDNGVLVSSVENTDIASFEFSGDIELNHDIVLEADYLGNKKSVTWIVQVLTPLDFDLIYPSHSIVSMIQNDPLQFDISVNDIDCVFEWYLNGLLLSESSGVDSSVIVAPSKDLPSPDLGLNNLIVYATGENKTISTEWVIDVAPGFSIDRVYPENEIVISRVNQETTYILSTNDVLTNIQWFINGELIKEDYTTDSELTFIPETTGEFIISANCRAGAENEETITWNLSVTEAGEPAIGESTNIIPIVAAAGVGFLLLSGKKK